MGYVDSGKAYLIQLGPPILLEQTTVAGWCVLAIPVERDPYASKKGERARVEWRLTRWRLTHGAWRVHQDMRISTWALEALVQCWLDPGITGPCLDRNRELDELVPARLARKRKVFF